MKQDIKTYKKYTAYPKKYEGSYWGNFPVIPETNIVENRNNFITDFNIDKFVKHMRKYIRKADKVIIPFEKKIYFDHYELYSINDSKTLLAVISPYNGAIEEIKEQIIADDWTEIYPIYSNQSVSFIKYIS